MYLKYKQIISILNLVPVDVFIYKRINHIGHISHDL